MPIFIFAFFQLTPATSFSFTMPIFILAFFQLTPVTSFSFIITPSVFFTTIF
jgi:hypothetical protein